MNSRRPTPSVSAIVVHYGDPALLDRFLDSVRSHPDRTFITELVIVDNSGTLKVTAPSTAERAAVLAARVVPNGCSTYSSGVNLGAAETSGDILLIMNNDIEWLQSETILPLLHSLSQPAAGISGPQLVFRDGAWQRSHGPFPTILAAAASAVFLDTLRNILSAWRFRRGSRPRSSAVDYVDGACMCVRRECFDALGGFDAGFTFYGEDVDFCYRASQVGWSVRVVPETRMAHVGGASSSREAVGEYAGQLLKARTLFVAKHFGPRRVRAYVRVHLFALHVRSRAYGLVHRLRPTLVSAARAQAARARHEGARRRAAGDGEPSPKHAGGPSIGPPDAPTLR